MLVVGVDGSVSIAHVKTTCRTFKLHLKLPLWLTHLLPSCMMCVYLHRMWTTFCVFTGLSQCNKDLMEVKYKVQLAVLVMICTLAHSERSEQSV